MLSQEPEEGGKGASFNDDKSFPFIYQGKVKKFQINMPQQLWGGGIGLIKSVFIFGVQNIV